jgi:hypothetical protein
MDTFLIWLSENPIVTTALIVTFIIIAISTILIFLLAFFQGREILFWPPKIGAKPEFPKNGSKNNILLKGCFVSRDDRSKLSQAFAQASLRSVRIFAGDLSWLEKDITTYSNLINRGVGIKILTDEPNASALQVGKIAGIKFRRYPFKMVAPIKASITDSEDEMECRALVVRRCSPRDQGVVEYNYWMKTYHGSIEFPVIHALSLLFDLLYKEGEEF